MKYNPDIHHRRSIRLQDYDYSQEGLYFVTLCVHERECLFGEIVDGKMQLNELGKTIETICHELSQHYKNIHLEIFVIMPNHFHGIFCFDNDNTCGDAACKGAINRAPTGGGFASDKNPMFHINLSRIIRWLKGRATFECRKIHADFSWQRNYHEHIIRDHNDYARIEEYIVNNPINWDNDVFYTK